MQCRRPSYPPTNAALPRIIPARAVNFITGKTCGKGKFMKFKKTISAALSMATLISSTSIVSFAAEDEAMKTALTYVKQRISIPEELEVFNHSTRVLNDRTTYRFSWTTAEDSKTFKALNVSICGKIITSYSFDDYTVEEEVDDGDVIAKNYSFAELSREQLIEKANKWIKVINPTVYKNISVDEDSLRVWLHGNTARVNIRRVSNGIPVNGQTGSLILNKNTGELINYNLPWVMGAGFAKPTKAISVETAIEGFEAEIPLELYYTTSYDYETKTEIPHLIYRQGKYGRIDALTGKLSTFEESYFDYGDEDDAVVEEDCEEEAAGDAVLGANKVTFTDAEIEKMEKEGSLIKADEALESLKAMGIFEIADNAEISYSNCNYNETYEAYTRYFNFEANNTSYKPIGGGYYEEPIPYDVEEVVEEEIQMSGGSVTINAETGELLSFSSWGGDGYEGTKLTEKNAVTIMNKYLDKLAGDKADEFKFKEPYFSYSEYEKNGEPKKTAHITYASSNSPRYIYDIPTTRENVSMYINGDKKIFEYNIDYYGIEYPKPDNIIDTEGAYDKYFEQIDYDLLYCCAIKEKKTLTAMVYNPSRTLYIDAFTGKLVNSDGSELVSYEKGEYTDLKGSKYEEIARILEMYNVTLMDENGRLNENEAITREQFSNLVSSIGCYYYNRTGGEKELSRQFAAKILTNNVINETCAEIPGIFKSPYKDVKESSKYVGYIAVASALGYIKGENGKFRPSDTITRGEALQMVYDFLK